VRGRGAPHFVNAIIQTMRESTFFFGKIPLCKWLLLFSIFATTARAEDFPAPRLPVCSQALNQASNTLKNSYLRLRQILRRIPYLYLTPYPHLGLKFDLKKFSAAKQTYLDVLKSQIDGGAIHDSSKIIPRSNDEKLALIEAVRELLDQSSFKNLPEVTQTLHERERDLVKVISRWKSEKGPITAERLKSYVDLIYMAANDDFFRLKNLPSWLFSTRTSYTTWARMRWEAELLQKDLLQSFSKLGLLDSDPTKGRLPRRLKQGFLAVANILINTQTVIALGFPVWFPRIRLPNPSWDYPKEVARKLFPIVVSGLMAYSQFQFYSKFNHSFEHDGIPEVTHLVTRESLEDILRAEFRRSYETTHGAPPRSIDEKNFEKFLKGLRLKELNALAKKANAGETPKTSF
jgi:hypothetical protein